LSWANVTEIKILVKLAALAPKQITEQPWPKETNRKLTKKSSAHTPMIQMFCNHQRSWSDVPN
jgi:hypothetical protein